MIKLLPKKIIALIIIIVGYTRIILSKYKTIIILSILCLIFMGLSAVLLYEKYHGQKFDIEQTAEYTPAYQIPEGYEIEYIPKTNLSKEDMANMEKIAKDSGIDLESLKYNEKLPNTAPTRKTIYIPDIPEAHRTYREGYNYIVPQPTYTPTRNITSDYDTSKEQINSLNKEIEERRIMQLESKVNNLELERDMRLLNY